MNQAAHFAYHKIGSHWERTGHIMFKNLEGEDFEHFRIIPEDGNELIKPTENNVIYKGDGVYYDPRYVKVAPEWARWYKVSAGGMVLIEKQANGCYHFKGYKNYVYALGATIMGKEYKVGFVPNALPYVHPTYIKYNPFKNYF